MKDLSYYKTLTSGGTFRVQLSREQAAAALKAYDHGIKMLPAEEINILDSLMNELKFAISYDN